MGAELILPNGQTHPVGEPVTVTERATVELEDAPPSMLRELVESGGLPFVKVIVNPENGDLAVLAAGLTADDVHQVFVALASVTPEDVAAAAEVAA